MGKTKKILIKYAMYGLHFFLILGFFALVWQFYYRPAATRGDFSTHTLVVATSYTVFYYLLSKIYGSYRVGQYRISELIYSQALACTLSMFLVYAVASIQAIELINPIPMLIILVVQFIVSFFWSIIVNRIYFSINKPKKTAIIYKDNDDLIEFRGIKHFASRWDVVKQIHYPEVEVYGKPEGTEILKVEQQDIDYLTKEISDCEVVFISGINIILRNKIVQYCIETGIKCYFVPHTGDVIVAGAKHVQSFNFPLLHTERYSPNIFCRFNKRLFDVVVSFLAIILTSPIMLVTAIAIKLEDGGPVFYKQKRYTIDNSIFEVLKFRSMKVGSDKFGATAENDNRITQVGNIIRAVRFDELPQLFNILKGDMSVVGPRPEWIELVEKYRKEMPAFDLRLQVKGGLTGYAQIYGRYNSTPKDKLKMDLMYINNVSFTNDIRIILATIRVLFSKESTEGFDDKRVSELRKESTLTAPSDLHN